MNNKLIFPEDFKEESHYLGLGTQWVWPKEGNVEISIIGGYRGLYGDGIITFEMYDFREDDVQGWLSKDQINEHLKNNPF